MMGFLALRLLLMQLSLPQVIGDNSPSGPSDLYVGVKQAGELVKVN